MFLILTGIVILIEGCRTCGDPPIMRFVDYCYNLSGLCPYKGDSSLILSGVMDTTKIVIYDQDNDTLQHQIIQDCIRIKMDTGSVACDKFNAMNESVNDTMIDYLIVIDYNSQLLNNDTFGIDFIYVPETPGGRCPSIDYVLIEFYRKINDNWKLVVKETELFYTKIKYNK